MSEWTWAAGTPKERAEYIRSHRWIGLSAEAVCELFGLSEAGFRAIIHGADWSAEHANIDGLGGENGNMR